MSSANAKNMMAELKTNMSEQEIKELSDADLSAQVAWSANIYKITGDELMSNLLLELVRRFLVLRNF